MNIKEKIHNSLKKAVESDIGTIGGIKGSGTAAISALLEGPLLVAVDNENDAEILKNDVLFYQQFFGGNNVEVLPYPSEADQSGRRAKVLYHLSEIKKIISYPDALLCPARSPERVEQCILTLKKGQEIERDVLEQHFREMGYHEVPVVGQKGDYSLRNWVMDIFPSTEEYPLRIEFFGDVIEALRCFRIDTQRSIARIEDIALYPAKDICSDEDENLFIEMEKDKRLCLDVEGVLQKRGWDGDTTTVTFVSDGDDEEMFKSLAGKGILYEERNSIEDIPNVLKETQEDIVIVLPNRYQAKRVSELFEKQDMYVPVMQPQEINTYSGGIIIIAGNLSEGLHIDGLLLLTQKELFGKDVVLTRRLDSGGEGFLNSFEDIKKGDFVVHKDHGIGKFEKLARYQVGESDIDVAVIEYAESSILYMPLYNIQKIYKYRAGEGVEPVLDSIGGKTWSRKKRGVKKRIDRMVKKLLELYARRGVTEGFSFSSDTEVHREFYSFFPYEETVDQVKAINEIFTDMESQYVMDRLLCGDVGFGKTEVAMRSVFKTVYDGKQVAVIVPTTVLCEQHYRNFKERFSAFPVSIDYISRFKSASRIKGTIVRLEKGEIDIIIATHALLKRNVEFRNLGLLIIDEEHRFGVAQKERIKEFKKGIDCLMLSATPIPRTLQMSLSGIREMSIIETPPEERLSVKTSVVRFDKNLIRDAVQREIARGGQIFFVHNRIKDIDKMQDFLERLLPDVGITCAHGRMRTKELEDVMVGFINRDFDLLLCTNIIGSGIDIPTANTIFINMADRFGLADLYQLKGRVGRGSVKAYAYLLVSPEGMFTVEGKGRMKAIEQLSYLGAGLKLAMKDIEIRGAGTLLGYKQSGYIRELGFDMYMDLLKKEVQRMRGEPLKEDIEPEMDLNTIARIPDSYVSEDILRMSLYRRMSSIKSDDELEDFSNEMEDRFGSVPDDMKRLFTVISLKIVARKAGVKQLVLDGNRISVSFASRDNILIERFFKLAEEFKGIKYTQNGFEMISIDSGWAEMAGAIIDILRYLSRQNIH